MSELADMLMGIQPVHWYDVGRCTECGALIKRDDAEKHVEWHGKWSHLAQALADWAKASREANDV